MRALNRKALLHPLYSSPSDFIFEKNVLEGNQFRNREEVDLY